jgi:hypothetical protein
MSLTPKTETLPHAGGFIAFDLGSYNREVVTILSGQNLRAGAVLGKVAVGAATAAANAGNTANSGTVGAVTVSEGAKPGVYKLVCIEPASDAGRFLMTDPDGLIVGYPNTGVAFTGGGLAFTISDGSGNYVAGDGFTITVAEGSGKYLALDDDSAVGAAVAAAVLYDDVDASDGDAKGVALVRGPAELVAAELVWPAGLSNPDKAQAIIDLQKLGFVLR